ncbi:MAG: hypothetical protein PT977_03785 [Acidobacteriota bacterium]|nr:hypothetical protein [Acidobacteriota bacterium]
MTESHVPPPTADLAALGRRSLVVGALFTLISLVGLATNPAQFYRSYLVAFADVLGVALGSLAILMLHHLSGGAWGLVIRRILEASSRTISFVALFAVPLFFGLKHLYPWADPARVAGDEILRHRAIYMNPTGVAIRLAVALLLWTVFAQALSRMSKKQDEAPDAGLERKMQLVAAPGLALYCLLVTVVAIDLLMSLDPHWFSAIYGVYVVGGQALAGLAFTLLACLFLARRGPMADVLQPRHVHDLGKLLLAFTMLWAYFALSQFLIIWSGNLPEEIGFFKDRLTGGWGIVSLALALFHFALPFVFLLSRNFKRDLGRLVWVAILLLFMRWLDLYWLVAPAFHPGKLSPHWLDLTTPVALFGIWLWAFTRQLAVRQLLPVNDSGLAAALEVHAHD